MRPDISDADLVYLVRTYDRNGARVIFVYANLDHSFAHWDKSPEDNAIWRDEVNSTSRKVKEP